MVLKLKLKLSVYLWEHCPLYTNINTELPFEYEKLTLFRGTDMISATTCDAILQSVTGKKWTILCQIVYQVAWCEALIVDKNTQYLPVHSENSDHLISMIQKQ